MDFITVGRVIMDYGLRFWPENASVMDLFLKNIQLFTSQNINWGTESRGLLVDYCFSQLFGLSFWRHPFTTNDPLVSKWCNDTFLQICSDEETNSSTFYGLEWVMF